MSKQEKLLRRFLVEPPVKDFRWDELVSLMNRLGFDLEETSGGSSHKFFVMRSDPDKVIHTYRPHPGGILWAKQIREVRTRLAEWGVIQNEQ